MILGPSLNQGERFLATGVLSLIPWPLLSWHPSFFDDEDSSSGMHDSKQVPQSFPPLWRIATTVVEIWILLYSWISQCRLHWKLLKLSQNFSSFRLVLFLLINHDSPKISGRRCWKSTLRSSVCKIVALWPNFGASVNDEVYSISLMVSQMRLQVFLL